MAKLEIPLSSLAEMARTTVQNRRKNIAGRPWTQLQNVVHQSLLKKTFQGPNGIEVATGLMGLRSPWAPAKQALGASVPEIKRRLNAIVVRRNMVVHEGDLARQVRPRAIRRQEIEPALVNDALDFLEVLIRAFDTLR